ncbi:hypothetical protein A9978_11520 [Pseudomonas sp. UMC65]|uniref:phytanoyl-CoA dioxygenase family protein n=1 Tax=unclassified Pseudomonas TaxID=196821 RepID=UPI0015FEEA85|nr:MULTISPECIES: phytanoyl-CoA dioxygenase family protein [unclassified Pseudomonas]MBB1613078.1 hypothetical protein [Pseudomonas sp. UMC65]MBB1623583.1 hypothetical protein [Pseudomonas sp. UME65]
MLALIQETDHCLVKAVPFSADEIAAFRSHGFIKIKGFLTAHAIEALKHEAGARVISARDAKSAYGDSFNRLTYDLGRTEVLKRIYSSTAFRTALVTLTGHPLIMTESQSFELTAHQQGFAWHYDSLSFRYIRPQDAAFSVWIPLDPIHNAGQRGGMAYVPESLYSAKANFQLASLLSRKMAAGLSVADFSAHLRGIFNTPSLLTEIFEEHKSQDDFALGDVLFFSKSLWHRSEPLLPGPLQARLAVTIRFLDWRSRLDRTLFEGESESGGGVGMGVNWGKPTQTAYGSQFTDIDDGEEIRTSRHCGPII